MDSSIDHLYPFKQDGRTVLASDLSGGLRLFDMRRATSPVTTNANTNSNRHHKRHKSNSNFTAAVRTYLPSDCNRLIAHRPKFAVCLNESAAVIPGITTCYKESGHPMRQQCMHIIDLKQPGVLRSITTGLPLTGHDYSLTQFTVATTNTGTPQGTTPGQDSNVWCLANACDTATGDRVIPQLFRIGLD